MRLRILQLCAVFLLAVICTGCTSVSLTLDPRLNAIEHKEVPVKFFFRSISWELPPGSELPDWFAAPQIAKLTSNIKDRAPGLFVTDPDDADAVPLTFHFRHVRTDRSNMESRLLPTISFSLIPFEFDSEDHFLLTLKVGIEEKYTMTTTFRINEKRYFSILPLLLGLMPDLLGSFCQFKSDKNTAVDTPELQNLFLRMIYQLDAEKLKQLQTEQEKLKSELKAKRGTKVRLVNLAE